MLGWSTVGKSARPRIRDVYDDFSRPSVVNSFLSRECRPGRIPGRTLSADRRGRMDNDHLGEEEIPWRDRDRVAGGATEHDTSARTRVDRCSAAAFRSGSHSRWKNRNRIARADSVRHRGDRCLFLALRTRCHVNKYTLTCWWWISYWRHVASTCCTRTEEDGFTLFAHHRSQNN